jgi:hypothetical protein
MNSSMGPQVTCASAGQSHVSPRALKRCLQRDPGMMLEELYPLATQAPSQLC